MPSRDSIEGLRTANRRLDDLVQSELEIFFRSLDLADPAGARDALLAYVPILVETFGLVAQEIALEWYDAMRFEVAPEAAFRAIAPPMPDLTPAVEGSIRYAAGHLFRNNADQTLEDISGAVQKHVMAPGRETMIFNSDYEGVYWARVPTGDETCSFCLLLSSRGAAYISERSAGSDRFGEENTFHHLCDCLIVPFGPGEEYPEGYIPDDLYEAYDISARAVGSRSDLKKILYDMRRRFPNQVKDGVDDPDYLSSTPM